MQSRKVISSLLVLIFTLSVIVPQKTYSQPVFHLPATGQMVMPSETFFPATIKGIKIFPNNPLRFDFVLDTGDEDFSQEVLRQKSLRKESQILIKYFLAALTIPEEDVWVNLSPYESERIIPNAFGQTEMGRDLLAQDYLLKQLTSSLMYPEEEIGEAFWEKIYAKAQEEYGNSEIPVNTFNKVWIVPQKAVVYENSDTNTAFVVEAKLKVMLEEDYLALEEFKKTKDSQSMDLTPGEKDHASFSPIVREIILPAIEKEINEGKHFAQLRQIYYALILASWFKQNLKQSVLGQVYVDRNKVAGINVEDKEIGKKIYNQYLKAFETGVYNYIREEYDPIKEEIIPRKYFSGGVVLNTTYLGSPVLTALQPKLFSTSPYPTGSFVHLKINLNTMIKQYHQESSPISAELSAHPKRLIFKVFHEYSSLKKKVQEELEKNPKVTVYVPILHFLENNGLWDNDFIQTEENEGKRWLLRFSLGENKKLKKEFLAMKDIKNLERGDILFIHYEYIYDYLPSDSELLSIVADSDYFGEKKTYFGEIDNKYTHDYVVRDDFKQMTSDPHNLSHLIKLVSSEDPEKKFNISENKYHDSYYARWALWSNENTRKYLERELNVKHLFLDDNVSTEAEIYLQWDSRSDEEAGYVKLLRKAENFAKGEHAYASVDHFWEMIANSSVAKVKGTPQVVTLVIDNEKLTLQVRNYLPPSKHGMIGMLSSEPGRGIFRQKLYTEVEGTFEMGVKQGWTIVEISVPAKKFSTIDTIKTLWKYLKTGQKSVFKKHNLTFENSKNVETPSTPIYRQKPADNKEGYQKNLPQKNKEMISEDLSMISGNKKTASPIANPGGIDFTPDTLPLETRGEGVEWDIPFSGIPCMDTTDEGLCEELNTAALENINGVTPVIFQMVPLQNINLFLGLTDVIPITLNNCAFDKQI